MTSRMFLRHENFLERSWLGRRYVCPYLSSVQCADIFAGEFFGFLSLSLQPSLFLFPSLHPLTFFLFPSSPSPFPPSLYSPPPFPSPHFSYIHSLLFFSPPTLLPGECDGWLHQTSTRHFPREDLLYCNQGGRVSCQGNSHEVTECCNSLFQKSRCVFVLLFLKYYCIAGNFCQEKISPKRAPMYCAKNLPDLISPYEQALKF